MARPNDLQTGHELLLEEMRKHDMGLSNAKTIKSLKELVEELDYKNVDDLLINIGGGKESAKSVTHKLLKMFAEKESFEDKDDLMTIKMITGSDYAPKMITNVNKNISKQAKSKSGIIVEGIDDPMVRISKCCNPVPGDDILGFVTRGRGVSVHRANCPNAKSLLDSPERIIPVR